MRDLTINETLNSSGGNTFVVVGVIFAGSTILMTLAASYYMKNHCGSRLTIIDNTYIDYIWGCFW